MHFKLLSNGTAVEIYVGLFQQNEALPLYGDLKVSQPKLPHVYTHTDAGTSKRLRKYKLWKNYAGLQKCPHQNQSLTLFSRSFLKHLVYANVHKGRVLRQSSQAESMGLGMSCCWVISKLSNHPLSL